MHTTPTVHGHDVIDLIHTATPPLTRSTLAQAAANAYGPHARFHTCSAHDMTLDQLLAFLISRGKVVERDGKLFPDLTKVCSHDGADHHDH